MGDPKKFRKKYETPMHPWNKTVIETERVLVREYGLKNKQEILIANSFFRRYKNIAKKLIAETTSQAEKEKKQILAKLAEYNLLPPDASLDLILGLELKDVLERRLQSQIFRKGLARTMKQARQFITHRHVLVGKKEITSPSYLVTRADEHQITFKQTSPVASEDHPERQQAAVPAAPVVEKKVAAKIGRKTSEGKKESKTEEAAPVAALEE
ncbi:30S ribosomal protein S4 [Candidatus Woesearchaeota archaeon]|nr:30S ribosomal protein S4 [Candidatus Woesearchaeota archaeon]